MEVKNCRNCRRLFNYLGGQQICPDCKEKIEKKFYEVKEYIRENPHAGINQIAEETDVKKAQLQQWVREERLQFSEDSDIALQCEKCGVKIYTGRFCDNCKKGMANDLTAAFEAPKPAAGAAKGGGPSKKGMRFVKK